MKSNPRGYCVVINNQNFDKHEPPKGEKRLEDRPGSQHDVESLKKLFTQLHFLFEVEHDKTAQEIKELVKRYKDMDHSNYNCFVLVILSHGSHGNICGVDGKDVAINDIVSKFDSISCESLRGKPKLFFIQACQGMELQEPQTSEWKLEWRKLMLSESPIHIDSLENLFTIPLRCPFISSTELYDRGTKEAMTEKDQKQMNEITEKLDELHLTPSVEQTDATVSKTGRADMLIAMATSPGFVSWRDLNKGTWFIQAVVYAFKYWVHSQDLNNIMTKVTNLVQKAETTSDRNKQCPEWRSSLGKSLFFFPGLVQPNVPQPPQENEHLPLNQQHPTNQ